jgi:hypothetical protein
MNRKFKKIFFVGLSLFIVFTLIGCVKRVVTIDSDPSGAKVYFYNENQDRGTTPCSFDFNFYGTFPIKLVKEGYEDLNTTIYLKAPPYQYFPIDFFSEVILPAHLIDKHYQKYRLTAVKKEEELE